MVELEIDGDLPATRLDSNWIKNWRNHYHADWASRYWAGEIYPHEEPVWECILNVPAWIFGEELRVRAWERVKEAFPLCLGTLELSRLAAFVGSDLGSVHAFLGGHERGLQISFFMNMRDANDRDFLDRFGALNAQDHPVHPEGRDQLERFQFSLNRQRFLNQFCSDSLMLAGWRPASHDRTVIE